MLLSKLMICRQIMKTYTRVDGTYIQTLYISLIISLYFCLYSRTKNLSNSVYDESIVIVYICGIMFVQ